MILLVAVGLRNLHGVEMFEINWIKCWQRLILTMYWVFVFKTQLHLEMTHVHNYDLTQ